MVVYNAASREVTAKIVYCGPGLSGKTTNLQFLHRRLEPSAVGQLLTLAATADRTIFFDLLPVELGDLKGYRIRFQVATVPGQSPYNETRRVVLRGVDGVVFVADSRWSMLPKNLESFQNLKENLEADGVKLDEIPLIVQFNKRDLADVLAIDALQEGLGLSKFPAVEAVATQGKGVVETFKLISKLTFVDILKRLQKRQDVRTVRDDTASSRLSTWKNTLLNSSEPARPPAAEPIPANPSPESPEDANMTMAIPLSRLHGVPAQEPPKPDPPSVTRPTPPFQAPMPAPAPEPAPASEPAPATASSAPEPLALENPFGAERTESPAPGEDTNPAFFPTAPAAPSRAEFDDTARVVTAAFHAVPVSTPSENFSELRDRVDHQDERIAGLDDVALRLAHLEEKSAADQQTAEFRQRLDGIEKRMTKESDFSSNAANDLRRDHASSRLALESAVKDLSATIDVMRRDLAEISSREMETVAQISRESLALQAGSEKIGFRMSEVESKFSDLAIAHTSRIGRVEHLLDELSQRSVTDREEIRRSLSDAHEQLSRLHATLDEDRRAPDRHREALAAILAEMADRLRAAGRS